MRAQSGSLGQMRKILRSIRKQTLTGFLIAITKIESRMKFGSLVAFDV